MFITYLCILYDHLQLWQVEDLSCLQRVVQTLAVTLQLNIASVEELQATLKCKLFQE